MLGFCHKCLVTYRRIGLAFLPWAKVIEITEVVGIVCDRGHTTYTRLVGYVEC